jgi:hypothetical protein
MIRVIDVYLKANTRWVFIAILIFGIGLGMLLNIVLNLHGEQKYDGYLIGNGAFFLLCAYACLRMHVISRPQEESE